MKRGRTYVAMILDRSGSMQRTKDETVKGYNEQVKTLLAEADRNSVSETFASLVTFNSHAHEEYFNAPVDILREMHSSQYQPIGWTAMYDAVGYTIEKLCQETDTTDEYNSYLIIIISDGEENRSRFWTADRLATKIQEMQDTNRWTFTYIGANQNLAHVQRNLKTKTGNMLKWNATKEGTTTAFTANARQMRKYLDGKASGILATDNYFDGAETAEGLLKQESNDGATGNA